MMEGFQKYIFKHSRLLYPLLGGLCGLLYVVVDEGILDELTTGSTPILVLHEFMDAIFPVLLGITLGLGIDFLRRQTRLKNRLSLKNDRLEKELLFNTLISQMLHEIRNPIHNISAALEDCEATIAEETKALLKRNLDKIEELKKRYGQWNLSLDEIDPEEPLDLKPWVENFIEDKIVSQIKSLDLHYTSQIDAVKALVHPLLLEQALLTLFSNAFKAIEKSKDPKRTLHLAIQPCQENSSCVRIQLSNSGTPFPEEVLQVQAKKPVPSRHGLGLGLLLLNKMLEQVGGKITLSNEQGLARVTVFLKGITH